MDDADVSDQRSPRASSFPLSLALRMNTIVRTTLERYQNPFRGHTNEH